MKELFEGTVSFVTPTFLGGADKNAELRAPAFKALLRFWWRIAVAKKYSYDVNTLLVNEEDIFGTVRTWPAKKSKLILSVEETPSINIIASNESELIQKIDAITKNNINTLHYLGYGVVVGQNDIKSGLISRKVFAPSKLSMAEGQMKIRILQRGLSNEQIEELENALVLMSKYASIGNSSRNGFGSLQIRGGYASGRVHSFRDTLTNCLIRIEEFHSWPSSFGCDDHMKPAIWNTKVAPNWTEVMKTFEIINREIRTEGKQLHQFHNSNKNWNIAGGANPRWPSQMRFHIALVENKVTKILSYQGSIFHIPVFYSEATRQLEIDFWKKIHGKLDRYQLEDSKIKLTREGV